MKRYSGILALTAVLAGCGEGSNGTQSVIESPTETPPQTETSSCAPGNDVSGEATYYDATSVGNCSFDATTDDMLVAALNTTDYGNAQWCGACAEVAGPLGSVTVKIVDRCPGCAPGDLDLSGTAFSHIANPSDGRVPITWKFVACHVEGDVSLRFKTGSNQWWSGIQVLNHRHPIASVEYQGSAGEFIPVERRIYNYFVADSGMGAGPVNFRITDNLGQQILAENIPIIPDLKQSTSQQFDACN